MLEDMNQWKARFFRHLRHWSWLNFIKQFNNSYLVVADDFFIKELTSTFPGGVSCKLSLPENIHQSISPEIEKILVFCARGEIALVKEICAAHPGKMVVSGTYGYALAWPDRRPRMLPFRPPVAKRAYRPPVLMLSTAYSDAEFIAQTLNENGLPLFHEHLSRMFISWLDMAEHFQISRFYDALQRHMKEEPCIYSLLQIDVLQALFAKTPFTLGRFLRFLESAGAKVILVSQKNRMEQAIRAEFFDRSFERSAWTMKANRKKIERSLLSGAGDSFGRYMQLAQEEEIIKAVETAKVATLNLTLETFLSDQQAGVRAIADFLDAPATENVVPGDYNALKSRVPGLLASQVNTRREMIDMIGLQTPSLV